MILALAVRLARRWWFVLPAWIVLEWVIAPAVLAVLAPLVWGSLVPQVLSAVGR